MNKQTYILDSFLNGWPIFLVNCRCSTLSDDIMGQNSFRQNVVIDSLLRLGCNPMINNPKETEDCFIGFAPSNLDGYSLISYTDYSPTRNIVSFYEFVGRLNRYILLTGIVS